MGKGMKKNKIQDLTMTALMAAILCIVGPIVIPIGMVPVSFANMAIYLTIILLDKKKATTGVAVYLLIGFAGIPVFSGFTGGVGRLFGPTGGYLIGYLVLSWIAGTILEKIRSKEDEKSVVYNTKEERIKVEKTFKTGKQIAALAAGTIGLYFFGTFWLMLQSNLTFAAALSVGVIPFLLFDMIKIVAAVALGNSIRKRILFMIQ